MPFHTFCEQPIRFKQVTDAFAREEIHSLLVELELIMDFGRDVALNDMQVKTIQDVPTQMGGDR